MTLTGTAAIFTDIYERRVWGKGESASGSGSSMAETEVVRGILPDVVEQCSIRSVLDLPCGDFHWMQHVDLGDAEYHGADIVYEIIARNNALHSTPWRTFSVMDILEDPVPAADLVICRDCLCHFSHEDALKAILNIRQSGGRYVLFNFYPRHYANKVHGNLVITTGQWYPVNLLAPPFRFPAPLRVWNEKCPTEGFQDKSLGLWLINDLPWKLTP